MFAYYGDGLNTGGKLANVAVCLFNQVPNETTGKFQSYPLKVVELVTSVPFSDNYETACKSVLGHSYKTSKTDKEYTINIANSYYANMISESNTMRRRSFPLSLLYLNSSRTVLLKFPTM